MLRWLLVVAKGLLSKQRYREGKVKGRPTKRSSGARRLPTYRCQNPTAVAYLYDAVLLEPVATHWVLPHQFTPAVGLKMRSVKYCKWFVGSMWGVRSSSLCVRGGCGVTEFNRAGARTSASLDAGCQRQFVKRHMLGCQPHRNEIVQRAMNAVRRRKLEQSARTLLEMYY